MVIAPDELNLQVVNRHYGTDAAPIQVAFGDSICVNPDYSKLRENTVFTLHSTG